MTSKNSVTSSREAKDAAKSKIYRKQFSSENTIALSKL